MYAPEVRLAPVALPPRRLTQSARETSQNRPKLEEKARKYRLFPDFTVSPATVAALEIL
jgi:hypothetical protein